MSVHPDMLCHTLTRSTGADERNRKFVVAHLAARAKFLDITLEEYTKGLGFYDELKAAVDGAQIEVK